MKKTEVKKEELKIKKVKKQEKDKSLKIKLKELEDKLLRNEAELQNYKRRKEEEINRMFKYCNEDIIKEILPILDNFERAIEMDDDNLDDEVSRFLEGFKMIYASFNKILTEYEVKEIEALGLKFDPIYHQPLLTEHNQDKEDELILEVLQKGYLLKDKVIRPTMVKVNINKEELSKETENKKIEKKEKERDLNE